jgi:hypothetical protein
MFMAWVQQTFFNRAGLKVTIQQPPESDRVYINWEACKREKATLAYWDDEAMDKALNSNDEESLDNLAEAFKKDALEQINREIYSKITLKVRQFGPRKITPAKRIVKAPLHSPPQPCDIGNEFVIYVGNQKELQEMHEAYGPLVYSVSEPSSKAS